MSFFSSLLTGFERMIARVSTFSKTETFFLHTPLSFEPSPLSPTQGPETLPFGPRMSQVQLVPLKRIADERGQTTPALRTSAPYFQGFGELSFSEIYSSVIKGWTIHDRFWLHLFVPRGRVRFVVCEQDPRFTTDPVFQEVVLSDHQPQALILPPGIAFAWKNIAPDASLIATVASGAFTPGEARHLPLEQIPYNW